MIVAVAAMTLFGVAGMASATTAAPATDSPCFDTPLSVNQVSQFDRCINNNPNGNWAGLDCIENVNVYANGNSPFNVYSAYNNCPFRVWLHQYKNGGGWTFCISPDTQRWSIGAPYQNPLNIYLSSNSAKC